MKLDKRLTLTEFGCYVKPERQAVAVNDAIWFRDINPLAIPPLQRKIFANPIANPNPDPNVNPNINLNLYIDSINKF